MSSLPRLPAGLAAPPPPGLVPVSAPSVGERELAAIAEVFADGYLGMGSVVAQFEEELATFFGGNAAVVCTSSGTSALHLACAATGLGPGDEVLVPAITFVASFQAVHATGARPIPCDIDPASGLLDVADARRRLTEHTRAIMPVHFGGYAGNLDDVLELAAPRGLRVIEDAAHAFGSLHHGRLLGSFGDVTCFSFDPIKNITCGEGGAVVTRDTAILEQVRAMRRLGIAPVPRDPTADPCDPATFGFDVAGPGWRYHLPNVLAAIGRVQLQRFREELQPHRARLATLYRAELQDVAGLHLTPTEPGVVPHVFAVRVDAARREPLRAELRRHGFDTLVQYPPAHRLRLFRADPLPGAEQWFRESFTLPLHHRVSAAQVQTACAIIRQQLGSA